MVSQQTVTLANSIVGVSVLAMPFCFKQCGIILATLMLMVGAVITRMVCYFLLKAGTITRRRNYEMLAWHTFGQGGKFIVEISIIGFLIGTLIAFFVVMGDLGPEIASEVFDIENNYSLRIIIMTALSLFVALPLGLLKNIDSLSSVSTASVLFYVFLVCKILSEGLGPLLSGSYLDRIDYWKPSGVLQSIPILSMALSCQTQIFTIYETLADPTLHKMNEIVKQAVNICTIFYFCIGFFGYIAFSHQSYGGNILMTFSPSSSTQLIKLCFLLSIVFSVPLVLFPCRASLHSLIFRRVQMHHSLHDVSTNYIPDERLKFLTISIIGFTLIVGILIPNIELVLGLVGSTTGSIICIIFPSVMFIRVISKQTTEKLVAQIIFCTGVVIMVVSTYATLYAVDQSQPNLEEMVVPDVRVTEILNNIRNAEHQSKVSFEAPAAEKIGVLNNDLKNKLENLNKMKSTSTTKQPSPVSSVVNFIKVEEDLVQRKSPPSEPVVGLINVKKIVENSIFQPQPPEKDEVAKTQDETKQTNNTFPSPKVVAEDREKSPPLEKHDAVHILKKLEEHQENQKKLLEEQKKILEELKEHHEQDVQRQVQEEDKKVKDKSAAADELINAVAKEEKPKQDTSNEKINQQVIEQKVESLKQEKLIEKLSENIEKEKENVKIIEKIEEGLNKEIVKNEEAAPNPKQNFIPEHIPPPRENSFNEPMRIVVGERIGDLLKQVEEASSSNGSKPSSNINRIQIVEKRNINITNVPVARQNGDDAVLVLQENVRIKEKEVKSPEKVKPVDRDI